jgi:hypothetical protein
MTLPLTSTCWCRPCWCSRPLVRSWDVKRIGWRLSQGRTPSPDCSTRWASTSDWSATWPSPIVIDVELPGGRQRRQRRELIRSTQRGVANALGAGSRAPDVAARLADFRFALLAPCSSASAATSLAERLRLLLPTAAGATAVAVRLGVATVGPGSVGTPHGLLDAAISALENGCPRPEASADGAGGMGACPAPDPPEGNG